jgi:hypothetical protein
MHDLVTKVKSFAHQYDGTEYFRVPETPSECILLKNIKMFFTSRRHANCRLGTHVLLTRSQALNQLGLRQRTGLCTSCEAQAGSHE